MKNTGKVIKKIAELAVMAIIGLAALSVTGCPPPEEIGNNNKTPTIADFTVSSLSQIYDGSPKAVTVTAKSGKSPGTITVYYNRLSVQPTNTAAAAYTVALNLNGFDSDYNTFESIKYVLNANSFKYVNLDFSGSTITTIPDNAFNTENPSYMGCLTLTGY